MCVTVRKRNTNEYVITYTVRYTHFHYTHLCYTPSTLIYTREKSGKTPRVTAWWIILSIDFQLLLFVFSIDLIEFIQFIPSLAEKQRSELKARWTFCCTDAWARRFLENQNYYNTGVSRARRARYIPYHGMNFLLVHKNCQYNWTFFRNSIDFLDHIILIQTDTPFHFFYQRCVAPFIFFRLVGPHHSLQYHWRELRGFVNLFNFNLTWISECDFYRLLQWSRNSNEKKKYFMKTPRFHLWCLLYIYWLQFQQ